MQKYEESWVHQKQVHLVSEMCEDGDLWKFIQSHMKNETVISEEEIISILCQACEGLAYLHNQNVPHRDIKNLNLLRNKDGTIKIGDLGLATELNCQSQNMNTIAGTPGY